MIDAVLGWVVVVGLLIMASGVAFGLPLALARRAMPRLRVSCPVFLIVTLIGAVAFWYLIPLGVHALVGRVPY